MVRDIYNRSSGSHHVTLTWHRPYAENGVITFFVVRIYELDVSLYISHTIFQYMEFLKFIRALYNSCLINDVKLNGAIVFNWLE